MKCKNKKKLFLSTTAIALTGIFALANPVNALTPKKVVDSNVESQAVSNTCLAETSDKYNISNSSTYNADYKIDGVGTTEYTIKALGNIKLKITNIETGYYSDSKGTFASSSVSYLDNSQVQNLISSGAIISGNGQKSVTKQKINIKSIDPEVESIVRVTIVPVENAHKCKSGETVKEMYIDLPVEDSRTITTSSVSGSIENKNYNGALCQAIRGEISTEQISEKLKEKDFYEKYYRPEYASQYLRFNQYCSEPYVSVNYDEDQLEKLVKNTIKSVYFINKQTSTGNSSPSFQAAFEEAKTKAIASGHSYNMDNEAEASKVTGENAASMKCQYQKISSSRTESGEYNFENKEYYYGTTTKDTINVTYKYSYDGETYTEETKTVCSKKCEESVVVEYGPPQAVTAGLCFEYQVKVESRVKCSADYTIDAQPSKPEVCTPRTKCIYYGVNGIKYLDQAGPNTEYDACIQKCDGGKYTEKCSNSCYKKVYGKSNTKKTGLQGNSLDGSSVKQIANWRRDFYVGENGYYKRTSDGIKWIGGGCARYYKESGKTNMSGVYSIYTCDAGDGFKRAIKGNGLCQDNCTHVDCPDNTYLNTETREKEYAENMEKYNAALEKCDSVAACSTKTATFTITSSYSQNGEEVKIDFPTEGSTAELTSGSVSNSNSNILLEYDGCYKENGPDKYKAKWSFPGTWINNKTGEISFKEITDTSWHSTPKKFCTPLNIDDTNEDWWKYNYNQTSKDNDPDKEGSYVTDEYENTCGFKRVELSDNEGFNEYVEKAKSSHKLNLKDIDWNIQATTRNFGYFGWNFNVECFYAVNSSAWLNQIKEECETRPNNYTLRPVKTANLFPGEDKSDEGNSTKTGRTPGYNWTESASIPLNKADEKNNYAYAVNTKDLITKIQERGDSIYQIENESEYLDYAFKLTPQSLKAIRNDTAKNGFDKWSGKTSIKNGVYVYESGLFRVSPILKGDEVVQLGTLGVNNQDAKGKDASNENAIVR